MRIALAAAGAALALITVPAAAQAPVPIVAVPAIDPHALQLAREIITLSVPARFPTAQLPRGVVDLNETEARAFTRQLSLADLEQIHAFLISPAGQHYANIQELIAGDPEMVAYQRRVMAGFVAQINAMMAQAKTPAPGEATPPAAATSAPVPVATPAP